jgi:hypothetical protein
MGMAQTRILKEPPEVTPKQDVQFDIPTNQIGNHDVVRIGNERPGKLTSVQLTNIALEMVTNKIQNSTCSSDLTLAIAARAGA